MLMLVGELVGVGPACYKHVCNHFLICKVRGAVLCPPVALCYYSNPTSCWVCGTL